MKRLAMGFVVAAALAAGAPAIAADRGFALLENVPVEDTPALSSAVMVLDEYVVLVEYHPDSTGAFEIGLAAVFDRGGGLVYSVGLEAWCACTCDEDHIEIPVYERPDLMIYAVNDTARSNIYQNDLVMNEDLAGDKETPPVWTRRMVFDNDATYHLDAVEPPAPTNEVLTSRRIDKRNYDRHRVIRV